MQPLPHHHDRWAGGRGEEESVKMDEGTRAGVQRVLLAEWIRRVLRKFVPPRWGLWIRFCHRPRAALVPRLPWAGLLMGLWPAAAEHALQFHQTAHLQGTARTALAAPGREKN